MKARGIGTGDPRGPARVGYAGCTTPETVESVFHCTTVSALDDGAVVTNNMPRLDTDGSVINAHSGMILAHNGTHYTCGEHYGNTTRVWPFTAFDVPVPQIVVYTPTDMQA